MSRIALILARLLWWWMLWLMRRPGMKNLQRKSARIFPERMRPRAQASLNRQNAFARRYGLRMLTVSFNLLLASIAITGCFYAALYLLDSGVLTLPESIRQKTGSEE